MSPQIFRTPRRRQTRQRSGFHVSGGKSGNESSLSRAIFFEILSPTMELVLKNPGCECPALFNSQNGMAAMGGYIKPDDSISVTCTIWVNAPDSDNMIFTSNRTIDPPPGVWSGFGNHADINDVSQYDSVDLKGVIHVESQNDAIGGIQLFGVNLDSVNAYSEFENRTHFDIKTFIYIPGIYYFKEDEPSNITPLEIDAIVSSTHEGEQLVLKACNRCARFLIIDVMDERTALSFSNHCVRRAPCSHGAFSKYIIENGEEPAIDKRLLDSNKIINVDGNWVVNTYYGYQLECRTCKKFTVNAPLNPLRNETQHREDSLRRRAFEQLLAHLLGHDWIFFQFRHEYGNEFDKYIWEKFERRCFGCGKQLQSLNLMDLDHTLPLNYLWPLDDTATCLCSTCNSQKHNKFPFEFAPYQEEGKLHELADLTGLEYQILSTQHRVINGDAVINLKNRIVWFFDEFLQEPNYQKIRQGKKAADLIVASLQRVFVDAQIEWKLVDEYIRVIGNSPASVTLSDVDDEVMTEQEIDVW